MKKQMNPLIQSYLAENNMELLHFGEIDQVQEVRAAYLKKTDTYRAKDFTFDFDEKKTYLFFIAKFVFVTASDAGAETRGSHDW